jgi:hypothetical protein
MDEHCNLQHVCYLIFVPFCFVLWYNAGIDFSSVFCLHHDGKIRMQSRSSSKLDEQQLLKYGGDTLGSCCLLLHQRHLFSAPKSMPELLATSLTPTWSTNKMGQPSRTSRVAPSTSSNQECGVKDKDIVTVRDPHTHMSPIYFVATKPPRRPQHTRLDNECVERVKGFLGTMEGAKVVSLAQINRACQVTLRPNCR